MFLVKKLICGERFCENLTFMTSFTLDSHFRGKDTASQLRSLGVVIVCRWGFIALARGCLTPVWGRYSVSLGLFNPNLGLL
jgi:hypothetical protein